MKTCTKCGKTLSYEEFPRNKNNKDGYHSHCRGCNRAYMRKYYANNFDNILEQRADRYAAKKAESGKAVKGRGRAAVRTPRQEPALPDRCETIRHIHQRVIARRVAQKNLLEVAQDVINHVAYSGAEAHLPAAEWVRLRDAIAQLKAVQ